MAYSKSYVGDTVATGALIETINTIGAIVPNVTINAGLAGSIKAQSAEFYYNFAPLVADADAGDDFESTNVGNKKATIILERALQIDEKVPRVALESASDGGLQTMFRKAAIAIENARGKKFISDLTARAKSGSFDFEAKAYDIIAEAIKTFNSAVSTTVVVQGTTYYSNAINGISPNAIIVGDKFLYRMRTDTAFKNLFVGNREYPAIIGKVFGLDIVYSKHLTLDGFILVYADGVAYPYSVNLLRAVESEDFNGIRIQAEIGIPNASQTSILPVDTHAMVFTPYVGKVVFKLNGGNIDGETADVEVDGLVDGSFYRPFLDTAFGELGVVKANHSLSGFSFDLAGEETIAMYDDVVDLDEQDEEVTIYLQWVELPKYNLTVDLNGGNISADESDVVITELYAGTVLITQLTEELGTDGALDGVAYTGKTVKGFSLTEDGALLTTANVLVTNTKVYIIWEDAE